MYEKLTGHAERLYAVEDIVTGYMYKVEPPNSQAFILVNGEDYATWLDGVIIEWDQILDALKTNPDVTLDDIREIMGVTDV